MTRRLMTLMGGAALLATALFAVEKKHGVLVGEILRLDAAAKTMVVKTADGAEHALRFLGSTAVVGVRGAEAGARDAFRGLKEGAQVAVHYTEEGSVKVAEEVDHLGKDGLKAAEVTVRRVDRGGKKLAVSTETGGEETMELTGRAAEHAAKEIGEGAQKSAKATVYYTEQGGRKVVHFVKKAI